MRLKLLSTLTAIAMLLGFTSCDSGTDQVQWSNFVTYLGVQDGLPAVSWQGMNDAEPITLLLNSPVASDVLPGTRMFLSIMVDPNETITNNTVVTPIIGYALKTTQISYYTPAGGVSIPTGWNEETHVYLDLLFRTGSFLNLQSLQPAETTAESMTWNFLVDNNTLNSDNIVAYLSYDNPQATAGGTYIYTYMNCIDISPLMHLGAKTLTVNINNNNSTPNPGWGADIGLASQNGKVITIPMPAYWD